MSNTQAKFYRNKVDLVSLEGIEVEAGSLWKLNPELNLLELIDEDQYVSAAMEEQSFEQEKE